MNFGPGFGNGGFGFNLSGGIDWQAQQRAKQEAEMKAKGLNPDGSPIRPEFETMIDKKTGNIKDQYQLNVNPLDMASLEGLSAQKKEALREGPSKWAQIQLAKQEADRARGLDQAQGSAAQAMATGRSSLAMRGGLSSGARERLASNSMRDMLTANQGVNAASNTNRFNLMSQDEQNRLGQLGQFASGENQLAQFNKGNQLKQGEFNLTNTLGEVGAKRNAALESYKAELSKWGAAKQAEATANSGGGGGK